MRIDNTIRCYNANFYNFFWICHNASPYFASNIAVNGGYIEFSNNEATIIADSAERARNIDVKRAQSAKKRAEQHMQEAKEKHNEREMLEAEIALRRAVNRLHVRENYGK